MSNKDAQYYIQSLSDIVSDLDKAKTNFDLAIQGLSSKQDTELAQQKIRDNEQKIKEILERIKNL